MYAASLLLGLAMIRHLRYLMRRVPHQKLNRYATIQFWLGLVTGTLFLTLRMAESVVVFTVWLPMCRATTVYGLTATMPATAYARSDPVMPDWIAILLMATGKAELAFDGATMSGIVLLALCARTLTAASRRASAIEP